MKHRVAELEGALLDAAVAIAEGKRLCKSLYNKRLILGFSVDAEIDIPNYSTGWAYAGPIIERESWCLPRLNTNPGAIHLGKFAASTPGGFDYYGTNPLIAAMRAYVASKYGDTVELP